MEERLNLHHRNISAMVEQGIINSIEPQRVLLSIEEVRITKQETKDGYDLLCHQLEVLTGTKISPQKIDLPQAKELTSLQQNDFIEQKIGHQVKAMKAASRASFGQLFPNIVLL